MKTQLIPEVNETQEFIEIAFDFSNPLDLVREAISNAFDASATEIIIDFSVIDRCGKKILKIVLKDNGCGMDLKGLASFFDLGNSMSRGNEEKIGEKGHGTKVYINSEKIQVDTQKDGELFHAIMNEPKYQLYEGRIPVVDVESEEVTSTDTWTQITIWGYNNDDRRKFTHDRLKDYILWFTKMGSIEKQFGINKYENVILKLKGVDKKSEEGYEVITFGHVFPEESLPVDKLLDTYLANAPKYHCKKWIFSGRLEHLPEVEYQAVFFIEGRNVKYTYNPMVRRSGWTAPLGAYTVQERYGIWLCKDYMPIQRKNEWITKKGTEYTRFHAFVNCQELKLTANRGSVENTPSEVIQDLQSAVESMYETILASSDWFDIDYLESEADAYNTVEKEEKDYLKRIALINRAKIATYKGLHLVEPQKEQGVFSLFMQISQLEPGLFPFCILDYDTHSGIDVIAKKKNDSLPLKQDTLYYIEFKNILEKNFNHSFKHLYSIVCWDTKLVNGQEVEDVAKKKRIVQIIPPLDNRDYTRYYLDDLRGSQKIEIFVLKTYLKERLGIEFNVRTEKDCY